MYQAKQYNCWKIIIYCKIYQSTLVSISSNVFTIQNNSLHKRNIKGQAEMATSKLAKPVAFKMFCTVKNCTVLQHSSIWSTSVFHPQWHHLNDSVELPLDSNYTNNLLCIKWSGFRKVCMYSMWSLTLDMWVQGVHTGCRFLIYTIASSICGTTHCMTPNHAAIITFPLSYLPAI